jgi:hypothetical protein
LELGSILLEHKVLWFLTLPSTFPGPSCLQYSYGTCFIHLCFAATEWIGSFWQDCWCGPLVNLIMCLSDCRCKLQHHGR